MSMLCEVKSREGVGPGIETEEAVEGQVLEKKN
jgi:hypothetical protein